ncbi:putative uridine kinase [Glycine soja]
MEATFSSTTARGYWNQTRGSTEPLLLRVDEARDRKPSSLSIARPSKFVQLSLARTRKSSLFKVLSAEKEQIHVVEGSRVDELYDALVTRILPLVSVSSNPNHKLLVGLAGPPGAGKSTLAHEVARRINKLWPEKASSFDSQVQLPDVAIVVPMDGFHLYRSELDEMENPEEAHARRGAPWTFNPLRLLQCLKNLRMHGSVFVPSFDHGVGDPVEDDIFVNLQHKVVIVEGNYLLLEDGVWKEISSLFDEKWQVLILSRHMFIDIDIDKAMQRVLKRHISTGKPPDIAKQRIENNDRLNAELIMKSKKNADIIIKSIDF